MPVESEFIDRGVTEISKISWYRRFHLRDADGARDCAAAGSSDPECAALPRISYAGARYPVRGRKPASWFLRRGRKIMSLKLEKMTEGVEVLHALHLLLPPNARAGDGVASPRVKLDEAFFRGHVEPIFEKRGKDGYACVHCHASHTLFSATYSTVMNVVDTSSPEDSLLLRKPVSSSESEGVASAILAHSGGIRFVKDSPEYVTILQWLKGAKE